MTTAYYNELDPFAAQWLRELIKAGHIAPGDVDERSIEDVRPDDLRGYTQCHFFAGIGVWSYSLRRAGWDDDRPVWTGSCPCQPFSSAGKGAGFTDERHLWPAWFHLITTAKPGDVPVFGEQVASKDGLAWLDLVQTDLEGAGYTSGAVDLCAAGVDAPHILQRLFFVAQRLCNPLGTRLEGHAGHEDRETRRAEQGGPVATASGANRLAQPNEQQRDRSRDPGAAGRHELADGWTVGGMADADSEPTGRNSGSAHSPKIGDGAENRDDNRPENDGGDGRPSPTNGLWGAADWLLCRDGKWRPVEPGTFPLVDGTPSRAGRLRGYGNAINAEVAAAFIEAAIEILR